jgi:hypothetical protein
MPGRVAANIDHLGQNPGGHEHPDPVDAGQRGAAALHELGDLLPQPGQLDVDGEQALQPGLGPRRAHAVLFVQ